MSIQVPSRQPTYRRLANYLNGEPLLDWLHRYGRDHGYLADNEREGYDRETDFGIFIQEKSRKFRKAVFACLQDRHLDCIDLSSWSYEDPETALEITAQEMKQGRDVIYRGTLSNGSLPDLLLAPKAQQALALTPVPGYVPVSIRFANLHFNAKGDAVAAELTYRMRLYLEAQPLGVATGYLLGRGWKQKDDRGHSCLERLGPVDLTDPELETKLQEALAWLDRLDKEGANWRVTPEPSIPELRPNLSNSKDAPWSKAKQDIAQALEDPCLLWNVGPAKRDQAAAQGIIRFTDERATAACFGVTGAKQAPVLDAILRSVRGQDLVSPRRIDTEREVWGEPRATEFYVDFETVSSVDDDFSKMPEAGGQALIFMIGCGYMENGEWNFKCFTADRLTEECEAEIIDAWIAHMAEVSGQGDPFCFHWSPAEDVSFLTQYNSACNRQPHKNWPQPNWYDFLARVMRAEPVTIKGVLGYSLKPVAKAMCKHGLTQTLWTDGPGDGRAAMVGAWRCHEQAQRQGISMREIPLMQSIEKYNEVDCKVMQELIAYLRANH